MDTIILFFIICIEFLIILSLLAFRKSNNIKQISDTEADILNEAAYQRLRQRKQILSLGYKLYKEIPPKLYSNPRKCEIARLACQHFYSGIKESLEHI